MKWSNVFTKKWKTATTWKQTCNGWQATVDTVPYVLQMLSMDWIRNVLLQGHNVPPKILYLFVNFLT